MLISIITPVLNGSETLRETLESVRSQLESDTEHLLIDACSQDETLEIARGYSHLTIVSENDAGIYDGMNKGARMASGEWLLFLQSDDWLPAGALAAYKGALLKKSSADCLCGGAEAVQRTGLEWTKTWSVTDSASKQLTVENIALGEPMINARLIRRDLFLRLGGFSLEYSLASDRDFLLRAAEARIVQEDVQMMTYRYRWHEGSSTMTKWNALTSRLSFENLEIAKLHLAIADPKDREGLRRWHGRLTVQAAMNALECPGWEGLVDAAKEGIRINSSWPALFLGEFGRSVPGFLSRGGKTRSRILSKNAES